MLDEMSRLSDGGQYVRWKWMNQWNELKDPRCLMALIVLAAESSSVLRELIETNQQVTLFELLTITRSRQTTGWGRWFINGFKPKPVVFDAIIRYHTAKQYVSIKFHAPNFANERVRVRIAELQGIVTDKIMIDDDCSPKREWIIPLTQASRAVRGGRKKKTIEDKMTKWNNAASISDAIRLLSEYITRKFWEIPLVRYVIIDPLGSGLLIPRMVFAQIEFWLEIIDEMRFPTSNAIPITAQISAVRALFTESRLADADASVDLLMVIRYRALIIVVLGCVRVCMAVRCHLFSLIANVRTFAQMNWIWDEYVKQIEEPEEDMAKVILSHGLRGDTSSDVDKIDLLVKLAWFGDTRSVQFRKLVLDCVDEIVWEKEGEGEGEGEGGGEEGNFMTQYEERNKQLTRWAEVERQCQKITGYNIL